MKPPPLIERVVELSVRYRGWVVLGVVALVVASALTLRSLEFDALPDVTGNQVIVLTRAPGLTPEEIERTVTRRVEAAVGGLSGLVEQRSLSRYGISSVTAVFEDDVDPWLARQQVAERIATISELPAGVHAPELGPFTGGLGEIMQFTVTSSERSLAALSEIVSVELAPVLRAVPGVVEVNVWGGELRTHDIVVDPVALARHRLSLSSLITALHGAVGTVAGASLPAGPAQAMVRGVYWPTEPQALGEIAIATGQTDLGHPLRLGDVATLQPGKLRRIGAATRNGEGETVYVMVQMLRGGNALDTSHRLEETLAQLETSVPADVRLDVVYDRATLVHATLRTVAKNLVEGAALVAIVLLLMLGSVRAGLLVAAIIPLSMLGAAIGMVALEIPVNLMSLGAIDFGLLVDGAVVMVERSFHELAILRATGRDPDRSEIRHSVAQAMRSVARPMLFSVMVIVLVYVPIVSLQGVEGKMFRPMALTVVLALIGSLFLAMTYAPAATSMLSLRAVPRREPWLVRLMHRAYRPVLDSAMNNPAIVGVLALALLGLGGLAATQSGSSFVPQLDEGDLVIQTTRAADVSLATAVQEAGTLERVVRQAAPEVVAVSSRIGSPAVATDIMGLEQADVFVELRPREQWRAGLTKDALIEQIDAAIAASAPGGDPAYTQPIQMRFNELVGGAVTDVAIEVFGEDAEAARATAEDIVHAVSIVPGATDVRILAPPAVLQAEIRPRALDASQLGLSTADVLEVAEALRNGVMVGTSWDGPVEIPVRVRMADDATAFDLAQTRVPTPEGRLVPLSSLADVTIAPTPALVNRQDGQRRVVVGFNVRGGDLGDVAQAAQTSVDASIRKRPGVRLHWGGQFAQLQQARARLSIVIPIVLAGIVVLLVAVFGSARPALLIFANVPFAGVGGLLLLWARDMPISISAAVGFIALSGIAVLNGVVLMSSMLDKIRAGQTPTEATHAAALERMRPVMMTALVASLGFVPMAIATGVGAEVQRPLATVVVGGLVTSTLLTLLILPALFPLVAGRMPNSART